MTHRVLQMASSCLLYTFFSFLAHASTITIDFESGFGALSNEGEYAFTRRSGSTSSGNTGPSEGANGSTYYTYLETSNGSAHTAGDQGMLYLYGVDAKLISFYYHMYGADMGTLSVEIYANGAWLEVFSASGQRQTSSSAAWSRARISLNHYTETLDIRFIGTAAGGYRGDMAIDEISIDEQVHELIDFESGLGGMTNTGSFDLSRDSGGTSSGNTGPSSGAKGTSYYSYFEASGGAANSQGNTAYLEYDGIDANIMMFYYHMYGADIGTLAIDKFIDNQWLRIWEKSGQQHSSSTDEWTPAYVDVEGASKIRFVTIAAGGYRGDIAIDEVEFYPLDYINGDANFEYGLGWTNVGEFDWSVRSGSTPSGGTGPSSAKSGDSYAFIETSGGHAYSAGDTAILESPYMERADNIFFWYSMIGSHIGTLSLEAKNSAGNWVTRWSVSGAQDEEWKEGEVGVYGYSQFRFKAVAAGGYQGDIAIDYIDVDEYEDDEFVEFEDDQYIYNFGDNVEFDLCPRDPDGVDRVSYRIEGSTDWIDVSSTSSCIPISLAGLAKGTYSFEVRYVDDLGNVTFATKTFEVRSELTVEIQMEYEYDAAGRVINIIEKISSTTDGDN